MAAAAAWAESTNTTSRARSGSERCTSHVEFLGDTRRVHWPGKGHRGRTGWHLTSLWCRNGSAVAQSQAGPFAIDLRASGKESGSGRIAISSAR